MEISRVRKQFSIFNLQFSTFYSQSAIFYRRSSVVEPGGFDGWLEQVKHQRPRLVAMERLGGDNDLKPLEDWVAEDYRPANNRVFSCYVRKSDR